eukprot:TRINITY_DN1288_c0_g1_i1.p1 TRINITY_DN1288_c0_g1~~TRINITY_DN1288_c0_g1_i1.p1  ORF type:complete len:289 (-),score=76.24 TRINITY_DN1288_c0_g1_i1:39-905(-)
MQNELKRAAGTSFLLTSGVARKQGSRDHQEDAFSIEENLLETKGTALYAVYDGHGGEAYSQHASSRLPQILYSSPAFQSGNYVGALNDAFFRENMEMKEIFEHQLLRGGSTATVVLMVGEVLYVSNVGDSRSVLARAVPRGYEPIRMSRDHNFDDEAEKQRVEANGGLVQADRVIAQGHAINMSRALGDFEFKQPFNHAAGDWISARPTINSIRLSPEHEFLVVASDGLWVKLEDNEVVAIIGSMKKKGMSPGAIAKQMAADIASTVGSDNITIIIIFFEWRNTSVTQ